MLRNFLKTAVRNLVKQRFYTIINISGLAIGVACCLLIVLFVQDELSYDKYHSKSDRIYRVIADIKLGGDEMQGPIMPAPLAKTLVADFPEVETAMRFRFTGSRLIKRKEKDLNNIQEKDILYADQELFEVFDIEILEGDKSTALTDPNTIVISRRMADKYFPEGNAVGKNTYP